MTLAISSSPAISQTLMYADRSFQLGLAASGSLHANWKSNNGTFETGFVIPDYDGVEGAHTNASRHDEAPTFSPYNRTLNSYIVGRRVRWMGDGVGFGWSSIDSSYLSTTGVFGNLVKYAGGNAWNAKAVGQSSSDSDEVSYQFTTGETNKEKAGGLAQNALNPDPTNTSAPSLDFMWHLRTDGTAVARNNGVIIGDAVPYTTTTIFEVYFNKPLLKVDYMMNDIVIQSVPIIAGVWNLYPVASLFTVNGTMKENVQFIDTGATKQGSISFQLYGVFPVQPNYAFELNEDNNTLSSFAEDGTAVFRKKGSIRKSINLNFTARKYSEYLLIHNFWQWHQKHLKFYYRDFDFAQNYLVTHDSGLRVQVLAPDSITMAIVIRET